METGPQSSLLKEDISVAAAPGAMIKQPGLNAESTLEEEPEMNFEGDTTVPMPAVSAEESTKMMGTLMHI